MNKAFQAKLISEPLLSIIRDHDEFIQSIDLMVLKRVLINCVIRQPSLLG
ncbi:protein of unknown function, might be lipoprotein [Moritella yayanosii]|uniref:Uncharacterized protein n=1 Tax=Moritella yayanosii TaxID=69539 RepID=A0A330LX88_9GAMM|nr:protein of unknown function, might be lipoprotein [Moritella yayanosii]